MMALEELPRFKREERLLRALDWDSILVRVAAEKIQWKFNSPSAPWWERLVQMTKAILRKILRRAALDYEELITVLCDCEKVINSRPLTYLSEEVDVSPLTPEMFLREIPESRVADIDSVDTEKLSNRAKYIYRKCDNNSNQNSESNILDNYVNNP
ncbi:integrase catalytic domain-containing protein [Trichonephila clavipes]|nr:integrase catalytic domain-containing protein [Trichonephila clavipes]